MPQSAKQTKSLSRLFSAQTYYLVGTGTWFASHGIQNVMFAWLVTIVLNEPPTLVGVAQLALLFPATLLMLVGGSLSDRLGGRRVAVVSQCLAVFPLSMLAIALLIDELSFGLMIAYALCIGSLQAFVTPARDGLLNTVAQGRIQRTVMKVTLIQFVVQMAGFSLAGTADRIGGAPIVMAQILIIALGGLALAKLPRPSIPTTESQPALFATIIKSIVEGFQTVWHNASMRMVLIQNFAMGTCFMGSYVVTIPLLVRERYDGSSGDLAFVSLVNSSGLVLMLILQLFLREIRHKGNALLIAHGLGALVLGIGAFNWSFPVFLCIMFCWGTCGGVAMSMSRTIMQEQAPSHQRGSVMSFFSFSFMGAGPIGALVWGFVAEQFGLSTALAVACSLMFLVVISIVFHSKITRLKYA